jgi:hypothetical protein
VVVFVGIARARRLACKDQEAIMRKLSLAGSIIVLGIGGLASAEAQAQYRYGYYGYRGGIVPPGFLGGPVYGRPYGYVGQGPAVCGAGPYCVSDPYAAPHEIRGGYRTIYIPGRGRVIAGAPLY